VVSRLSSAQICSSSAYFAISGGNYWRHSHDKLTCCRYQSPFLSASVCSIYKTLAIDVLWCPDFPLFKLVRHLHIHFAGNYWRHSHYKLTCCRYQSPLLSASVCSIYKTLAFDVLWCPDFPPLKFVRRVHISRYGRKLLATFR
jgi:hypothetical protein